MVIEILSRQQSGTCNLTDKTGVEVWEVRAGGGEVQHVSTQRLAEVLRILTSVGNGAPSSASPGRVDRGSSRSDPLSKQE